VIRLRHCPFLELAEKYDQLVCRIHLGLMQGALAELRTPVTAARLEPFAEPDACLARLEHASAA
jgi:predicted ArsR family transcriptional regulator